jgi:hypothetical protein
MTEEIAKAVNLSPGLMHNKGTGQGPPFVVHTPWTVKSAYIFRKYPNTSVPYFTRILGPGENCITPKVIF